MKQTVITSFYWSCASNAHCLYDLKHRKRGIRTGRVTPSRGLVIFTLFDMGPTGMSSTRQEKKRDLARVKLLPPGVVCRYLQIAGLSVLTAQGLLL